MSEQVKSTAKISDSLSIAGFIGGNDDRFTMRQKDEFDGSTATIKIYEKAEALRLAKELMLWAENQ